MRDEYGFSTLYWRCYDAGRSLYFGKVIEPDFIKSPENGHINVKNMEETVTPEAPNLPQSVHETDEMPPK